MKQVILFLSLFVLCMADTSTISTRFYTISSKAFDDICSEHTELIIPEYRGYTLYEIPTSGIAGKGEQHVVPDGFGVDLLVEPLLWLSFGNFENPTKAALGVIPRIRMYTWKGFAFDLRSYFTFKDEIYEEPGYKGGTAVLSQILDVGEKNWLTVSAGWFTLQRWGMDLNWNGLFLENKIFLETQLGVTGELAFEDSLFIYTALDQFTGRISAGYRFSKYNLLTSVEAGRYLSGDWGGGFELLRRFGVVDIALRGFYTSLGANGGFSITMPLWFGRHPQWRRLRYGLTDSYEFKYQFKIVEPPAYMYSTKVDLKEKLWNYHPDLNR